MEGWFLYIAHCRDGTYYTGIAKDVVKRIEEHNVGYRCRYTKFRRPLSLVYVERCCSYATARAREKEVKDYSRKRKETLIGKTSRP
ncbi:MAG: GIY-YIG nuclease family protein [Candidatus Omnitrophica bacterium]|nr:GIY-YIG nuclease family protein [Candidatus Omnitrophota bacterium]